MKAPARRADWTGLPAALQRLRYLPLLLSTALLFWHPNGASAQAISQRGFVEASAVGYPQQTPTDRTQGVFDLLAREEVFVRPRSGLQMSAGVDFRLDSHDRVEDRWRLDLFDRGERRPRLLVRRLSATLTRSRFTVELGKQFVRWGRADIVNPTDRFAPRDFLQVVDSDVLGITAARATVQFGNHTLDAVWSPHFTPSRVPLPDQRWAVRPRDLPSMPVAQAPVRLPARSQTGIRWGHLATRLEYSVSLYDGFNHLPDLRLALQPHPQIERVHPRIRVYGADAAAPFRWITIRAEAAYFTAPDRMSDEYLLYVVQLERQRRDWLVIGGYAGDRVTHRRTLLAFAPERGLSRAFVGRVAHTGGLSRSLEIEGVVRQNGDGASGRVSYSQGWGPHWRATVAGIVLRGRDDDFLGQYRRNSHISLSLRYSF